MKNNIIRGLGHDILEIERFRKTFKTHGDRLIQRIFTPREQTYCLKYSDPIPHFAARFSAKESIVKALGTGIGETVSWLDIEIINDEKGKPNVHLSEKLNTHFKHPHLMLSMSHCDHYVSTVAIFL
jgi:holo-[acyl-carrier protein] synthase